MQMIRVDEVANPGMDRRDLDVESGRDQNLRSRRRELVAVVLEDQRSAGRWIGKNIKSMVEQLVDIENEHGSRWPCVGPEHRSRRDDDRVRLLLGHPVSVGVNA